MIFFKNSFYLIFINFYKLQIKVFFCIKKIPKRMIAFRIIFFVNHIFLAKLEVIFSEV